MPANAAAASAAKKQVDLLLSECFKDLVFFAAFHV
jgi:hypothetical protein